MIGKNLSTKNGKNVHIFSQKNREKRLGKNRDWEKKLTKLGEKVYPSSIRYVNRYASSGTSFNSLLTTSSLMEYSLCLRGSSVCEDTTSLRSRSAPVFRQLTLFAVTTVWSAFATPWFSLFPFALVAVLGFGLVTARRAFSAIAAPDAILSCAGALFLGVPRLLAPSWTLFTRLLYEHSF